MDKRFIGITCLFLLFFPSCTLHQSGNCDSTTLPGDFRLNYRDKKEKGWLTFSREECLSLFPDSTYVLKRISPQGSFEMLPDSGFWHIRTCRLILDNGTSKRIFQIAGEGLTERHCREKRLSNVLWKRE